MPLEGDGQVIISTTATLTDNTVVLESGETPIIPPLYTDDSYVLSKAFYTGGDALSILELLTRDYLKHQTLDIRLIGVLLDHYPRWTALERFYYGPLVMLLTKEAIRGFL